MTPEITTGEFDHQPVTERRQQAKRDLGTRAVLHFQGIEDTGVYTGEDMAKMEAKGYVFKPRAFGVDVYRRVELTEADLFRADI